VGLVEMRPRRGAVVSGFTTQRIIDMFEMSAEIEAMCVRLAAYRMNPMERSRLAQLHEDRWRWSRRGTSTPMTA
jgi:DNA-binding GntR family transcriptional regulator